MYIDMYYRFIYVTHNIVIELSNGINCEIFIFLIILWNNEFFFFFIKILLLNFCINDFFIVQVYIKYLTYDKVDVQ